MPAFFAVPAQIETPQPPQHKTASHNIGDKQPKLQRKASQPRIEPLPTDLEHLPATPLAEPHPTKPAHAHHDQTCSTDAGQHPNNLYNTRTHAYPPT